MFRALALFGLLLDQWREHIAGTDCVDGDAVFRRFERHRFRQPKRR
jgi:hypothetical protein